VIFGRPDAPGQPGTGLDAATIDPASLKLASLDGGTWVLRPQQNSSGRYDCVIFDVNRDGVRDFSCAFKVPKGTIGRNETRAVLRGMTLAPNPQPVLGWDFIEPKAE